MKIGIFVIVYNIDTKVFNLQIESIKRYCTDDYTIQVIDNSNDGNKADAIKYRAREMKVKYFKVDTGEADSSFSHAYACNYSYDLFYYEYDVFFFLDHDCIPFKNFSVMNILNGTDAAGVVTGFDVKYFWAGCFIFTKNVKKGYINFNPSHTNRTDTGGGTYKVINNYKYESLTERGVVNEKFKEDKNYYFYMIVGETFIHYLNTSNWRKVEHNDERIDSLIEITLKMQHENYSSVPE